MKIHLFLCTMCLALFACSTPEYLAMEALIPADVSFSPSVKRMAVLNNILLEKEKRLPDQSVLIPADASVLIEALAGRIADAQYFDQVVICDSFLRSGERLSVLLPSDDVERLCKDLNVDVLLTVDAANMKAENTLMYTDFSGEEKVPVLSGALTLETRLYMKGREKPFQRFEDKDTLYWVLENMVDVHKIKEVSECMAELPVSHIVPCWTEISRVFYRGGTVNMRDAAVAVHENDWEQARISWQKEYDTKKGKSKMRAAFNMSLYHEMNGTLDEALKWVAEARKIARQKYGEVPENKKLLPEDYLLIIDYEEKLQQKSFMQQKLDLQMKRF